MPRDAKTPVRLYDVPTWLISRNYARSNAVLSDAFTAKAGGLRPYHYRLMANLEEAGPVGQAELGRVSGIDRSDVANMLAELEQRGLVERTTDPSNRRRNIVALTNAGNKQLEALADIIDAVQEEVVAPLTVTERRQLMKLLRKLLTD
jgi:MarR family transcriptional regulator, lower aerobic nicotinate degradation pathway regulator